MRVYSAGCIPRARQSLPSGNGLSGDFRRVRTDLYMWALCRMEKISRFQFGVHSVIAFLVRKKQLVCTVIFFLLRCFVLCKLRVNAFLPAVKALSKFSPESISTRSMTSCKNGREQTCVSGSARQPVSFPQPRRRISCITLRQRGDFWSRNVASNSSGSGMSSRPSSSPGPKKCGWPIEPFTHTPSSHASRSSERGGRCAVKGVSKVCSSIDLTPSRV